VTEENLPMLMVACLEMTSGDRGLSDSTSTSTTASFKFNDLVEATTSSVSDSESE
jgi:hypothetical protein